MQQVTFIAPNGESVLISPRVTDYVFESISGIGAADTTIVVNDPAGMDGSLYHSMLMNDREVTLNLYVRGENLRSMYERRQKLTQKLSGEPYRDGALGQLWYENDYGRWWIPATVQQGPRERGRRQRFYFPLQVVFYCPDPAWRGEVLVSSRMAFMGGGFRFPLTIDHEAGIQFGARGYRARIENVGDVSAPVDIEVTGPAELPTIANRTTGESLTVQKALAEGDRLLISTERGKKRAVIIRSSDQEENAMGHIAPESDWLQMVPGVNELEYTSGDDTSTATATVTMYPRFGGV